jgi:hypothetical protein
MKNIVWARPDGGVSITTLDPRTKTTSEQWRDVLIERGTIPATWQVVALDAKIPSDRTFRNAWKADLTVDMEKAREIHREHLRQMRAPLLQALDVEYQRADERGDPAEKQRIAARKQVLRDVTKDVAIEAAQTPEELKAAIPRAFRP